jgi:hypothetical protein
VEQHVAGQLSAVSDQAVRRPGGRQPDSVSEIRPDTGQRTPPGREAPIGGADGDIGDATSSLTVPFGSVAVAPRGEPSVARRRSRARSGANRARLLYNAWAMHLIVVIGVTLLIVVAPGDRFLAARRSESR